MDLCDFALIMWLCGITAATLLADFNLYISSALVFFAMGFWDLFLRERK